MWFFVQYWSEVLWRNALNCPELKILRRVQSLRVARSFICNFLDSYHLHIRSLQRLVQRCLREDTCVALANEHILGQLPSRAIASAFAPQGRGRPKAAGLVVPLKNLAS